MELPYTEELLAKVVKVIEVTGLGPTWTAAGLAAALLADGIALVDRKRDRCWIDETVYEGAQHRVRHWQDLAMARPPVPMVLHCPRCGLQHVDRPDPARGWTNPPHRSHLCARCELIWRPADIATVGVAAIATRGRLDVAPPLQAGGLPFDHADGEAATTPPTDKAA